MPVGTECHPRPIMICSANSGLQDVTPAISARDVLRKAGELLNFFERASQIFKVKANKATANQMALAV